MLLFEPRQSGKTRLARAILARTHRAHATRCLNWDADEARTRILNREFPHRGTLRLLVTGSARLDLDRRGGDSRWLQQ